MRSYSLKPFRSASDSRIGSSRSSDASAQKVQPGSQRSLTTKKKVAFKESVSVMADSSTYRKNTVSAINEEIFDTERCMLKKTNLGGANRNKFLCYSPPDEQYGDKLTALKRNKDTPSPSVEHIQMRSVSCQKFVENELDLAKHRKILSAFYPNLHQVTHEDSCISKREILMKLPDRSGLLIEIDEALPEHQEKLTYSSAA